jgi:hypothetical protein
VRATLHPSVRASAAATAFVSCIGFVFAPSRVRAQPASPAASCGEWIVDYALAGSLELTDTPLGQGDGVYPAGSGSTTVRFDDVAGVPGGHAKTIAYEMHDTFKVVSKTLFWATTVSTDSFTRASPDPCDAAEGLLSGASLVWGRPIAGFHTDGTLFCAGSFCGKFGAPPPGESPLHISVHPVAFKTWQFSADRKTFTMSSTLVSKTDAPRQTAHLALSGREMQRTCRPKSCP